MITAAICFFNAADPAFRSANNAVFGRCGANAVAARNAALPPVRLRTRSAPATASATWSNRVTSAGVRLSAGSKPVTVQPLCGEPGRVQRPGLAQSNNSYPHCLPPCSITL